MIKASVFISHSNSDKEFATSVGEMLRNSDLAPWIDKERILVGTDILEELGKGLTSMDLFVLIVSDAAIKSGWVQKETGYAAYREITEKKVLILPFIIDETKVFDLPWHIHSRNVATITPDRAGVDHILDAVRRSLEQRETPKDSDGTSGFQPNPEVEALIKDMEIGDWDTAEKKALEVLERTDAHGRNPLFAALLTYRDAGQQETVMHALAIVETCAGVAPWIIDRSDIFRLAKHADFTVRSSAASICMEMARVAPGLVPIDILLCLSRYDEDWYVQAPANAALKTMAHVVPAVLRVYLDRLRSEKRHEREHAASQLLGIANEEPEILNRAALEGAMGDLTARKDKTTGEIIAKVLATDRGVKRKDKYKYGL
jgi:TIR domain